MGSLIADVVLLFIMLIGLLRIRFRAGDSYGLERVLWNQVRWLRFLQRNLAANFTDVIFVRKGLVWLLIAIVCEIPPTVRLYIPLSPPFSLIFTS
jgi:hypothetical protein